MTKIYDYIRFNVQREVNGAFIEAKANRIHDAVRRNMRASFRLSLSHHVRRNFISKFRYMFCELVRSRKNFSSIAVSACGRKVRNGETANGPSGMICAQELQNRRGKQPLPSRSLRLPFPRSLSLSPSPPSLSSPLIHAIGARC